ncbi:MAG: hypothetical protein IT430_06355 [Phycisphaerales bacterium]|nr:hypothetical protein [Phycisphaerales bacterium]
MTSSSTRLDQTREQGQSAARDIKNDLTRLKDDASRTVSDVAEAGREYARAGRDRAIEAGHKVSETGRDSYERFCEYVSENPTTSILIALGVGAVISRLLPHR